MARGSLKNICKLIDASQQSQPIEKAFIEDLKRSIELDEDKNKRKGSKYYKPSSMNCIRQMYYTRIGAKADTAHANYVLTGICNCGTDIHERVQKYVASMKDNGIDCEYVDVAQFVKERKLSHLKVVSQQGMETKLLHKTLNLSFLCDGIIKYCGKYYILELKTESSHKWYDRQGVDPSHYHQATAYSVSLELGNVIFVYINRDIFDFKSYMFRPTDDMKQDFVGLITTCDNHVATFTVPNRPVDIERKTCEYCEFKTQCRKDN